MTRPFGEADTLNPKKKCLLLSMPEKQLALLTLKQTFDITKVTAPPAETIFCKASYL